MAAQAHPTSAHVVPASLAAAPAAATAAAVAGDFRSIFATTLPALTNSGWAACPTPITWSVDSHELSADDAAEQIANLTWAFSLWSAASGLTFQFSGETAVAYDDAGFTMKPADGTPLASRHVYLAFVDDAESARLDSDTVGLAGPTQVLSAAKEITGGIAVFRTDHVEKSTVKADRSLYLHELGHVLGLSHADETANIMYPMVTDVLELGAGDVNGVKTMTKSCTAPPA